MGKVICRKYEGRLGKRNWGKENSTHPPVRRNLWYPKVARPGPRLGIQSISLQANTCGGAVMLRIGDVVRVRLGILRVWKRVGVWLECVMGSWMGLLVPLLRRGDVLWVRESGVLCMADGGLDILGLELGSGCSFGGGEGSVGLLIRDDGHIIGREPSTLLTEQTIPPA